MNCLNWSLSEHTETVIALAITVVIQIELIDKPLCGTPICYIDISFKLQTVTCSLQYMNYSFPRKLHMGTYGSYDKVHFSDELKNLCNIIWIINNIVPCAHIGYKMEDSQQVI